MRLLSIGAAALLAWFSLPVHAQAPAQQKAQVPGYYRMMLGEFEVTALYDGYVDLPTNLLKGIGDNDLQDLLARMFVQSTPGVQTAVNAYLINTGENLVLVDTGAAQCFGPTLGVVQNNLKAAGYTPDQVDTVLLTHLHPDHACGLLNTDGSPAYPNATVEVPKAEADFWLSEAAMAKAPEGMQGMFKLAQTAVAPYTKAGKLKQYQSEGQLLPGIDLVSSIGHTPGHTSYLFKSGEQRLLVWGDIVHNHAVQFAKPEVVIEFDVDSDKARESRQRLLAEAAEDKLWVAGAHLPFPGIGHVRKEAQGYAWVPVEFSPVRSDR
ncbi:MBL fold metallo-hydrolase [Pseudomonas sp. 8Z]|uniref:MBL fold metallo-hydrolase n=1 Tax=Pseudomonas sp. 8Z TaxID=2653166 RepID=UPI0012F324DF|nr:MBL fold metallo-hydrolase [Pseudomonas sp. 8Z]VXC74465.1 MBL fold metallo-hydrolase [Pseudomonas sp. 8Z]